MATIVGSAKDFAIEFEFVSASGDYKYGKIVFHAKGRVIGDWDDETALLNVSCAEAKAFLNHSNQRYEQEFSFLAPERVFELIVADFFDKMPYGLEEQFGSENTQRYAEMRDRFHLTGVGSYSMMDLLEVACYNKNSAEQVLIWKFWDHDEIFHAEYSLGTIERVIADYLEQLRIIGIDVPAFS
ncbi:MAG: Imm42 family immunity protein [Sumerlaeia bacterium]